MNYKRLFFPVFPCAALSLFSKGFGVFVFCCFIQYCRRWGTVGVRLGYEKTAQRLIWAVAFCKAKKEETLLIDSVLKFGQVSNVSHEGNCVCF